jgi:hypothetical protein
MKHERENEKALSDLAGKQKHQCFVVISTKKNTICSSVTRQNMLQVILTTRRTS